MFRRRSIHIEITPSSHLAGIRVTQSSTQQRDIEITAAGVRESHVHDVQIVKEAPNYRAE